MNYPTFVAEHFRAYDLPWPYGKIMHATLGVADETFELTEALVRNDPINILEEFGDLLFYLQALSTGDVTLADASVQGLPIVEASGELVGEVKKLAARSQLGFHVIQPEVNYLAEVLMAEIADHGFSIEQVVKANMAKLQFRHGEGDYASTTPEERRDRQKEREIIARYL